MKPIYALTALPLAAIFLVACAEPIDMAASWRGKTEQQLFSVWGPPPKMFEMHDGSKVIFYTDADPDDPARVYCYTRFYVKEGGNIYSATNQGVGNGCVELTSAKLAP